MSPFARWITAIDNLGAFAAVFATPIKTAGAACCLKEQSKPGTNRRGTENKRLIGIHVETSSSRTAESGFRVLEELLDYPVRIVESFVKTR